MGGQCAIPGGIYSAKQEGIVLKQCPMTSGLPTKMTKATATRVCREYHLDAIKKGEDHPSYCLRCKGKSFPAELTIINQEEMNNIRKVEAEKIQAQKENKKMSQSKNKNTVCASCGKISMDHRTCSGDTVCRECASLYGAINNRPASVVRAILKLRPDLFGELSKSDSVSVSVESDALKKIADEIGFTGENGDQLVESVGLLVQALDKYKEQCERLAAENTVIANQLSETQQRVDDLEAMHGELQDRIAEYESGQAVIASANQSLTEKLLDLTLKAMRGDVTGRTPEVIEGLRKAA